MKKLLVLLVLTAWVPFSVYADKIKNSNLTSVFNVHVINHPGLPALDKAQIKFILDKSSTLIEKAYQCKIIFNVKGSEGIDAFFNKHEARVKPYKIPISYYYKFHGDTVDRFKKNLLKGIKDYGDIDAINKLLSIDGFHAKDYSNALDLLLNVYQSKLKEILKIKTNKGELLINKSNWSHFSFRHFFEYIESKENGENNDLYLFNTLCIDNDLYWAPPHTLIRGGITNGVALKSSKTVGIWYYPYFSNEKFFKNERDGDLEIKEAQIVIANIIAHEIGAHIIMEYNDNYEHKGCLAVPPFGLQYKKYNQMLSSLKVCELPHEKTKNSLFNKLRLRVEVFYQQKNYNEAILEGIKTISIDADKESKAHVYQLIAYSIFNIKDFDSKEWAYYFLYKSIEMVPKIEIQIQKSLGYGTKKELPWHQPGWKNFVGATEEEIKELMEEIE